VWWLAQGRPVVYIVIMSNPLLYSTLQAEEQEKRDEHTQLQRAISWDGRKREKPVERTSSLSQSISRANKRSTTSKPKRASTYSSIDTSIPLPHTVPPSATSSSSSTPAGLSVDPFAESVFPTLGSLSPRQVLPRPAKRSESGSKLTNTASSTPLSSPKRKKCAQAGCNAERFARGYCAMHLTQIVAGMSGSLAPTPTSRIRATQKLWKRTSTHDRKNNQTTCTWQLIHHDDTHRVQLDDFLMTGERVVTINGSEVYRGLASYGCWKVDATIGKEESSQINLQVVVNSTPKGWFYELFVDDVSFDEAHANFVAQLAASTLQQRLEASTKDGDDVRGLEALREEQLRDALYIREHWSSLSDEAKTRLGGTKSLITWRFTIGGKQHVVKLEYGSVSGKKKIELDGEVIVEKKPSMFSTNKHKTFRFPFKVDGVPCEVVCEKAKYSASAAAAAASAEQPSNRPVVFDLLIDSISFERCRQTETELAGGSIIVDSAAQLAAEDEHHDGDDDGGEGTKRDAESVHVSPQEIVAARRNSFHVPLSAEEYQQTWQHAQSNGWDIDEDDESLEKENIIHDKHKRKYSKKQQRKQIRPDNADSSGPV